MHRILRMVNAVRGSLTSIKMTSRNIHQLMSPGSRQAACVAAWRHKPSPMPMRTTSAVWGLSGFATATHNPPSEHSRAATAAKAAAASAYGAQQIQVLEGLDPVRKRPGMYIGSTGPRGLHHLLWEVLDNAVDEVQGGFGDHVTVEVDLTTNTVTVTDNGRGIPTDIHPSTGKSALETVLTVLHAGGKFGGGDTSENGNGSGSSSSGYRVSGGLHGVGISVVNALSEELLVEVLRNGCLYRQSFSRGVPTSELTEAPAPVGSNATGTKVTFKPDAAVFAAGVAFDQDTITSRLRELAFLNAGATLQIRFLKNGKPVLSPTAAAAAAGESSSSAAGGSKQRKSRQSSSAAAAVGGEGSSNGSGSSSSSSSSVAEGWQVFKAESGLKEYVLWLNRDNTSLHAPALLTASAEGVDVEVALQWAADTFSDTLVGFANSIKTIDGGSHMDGLRSAVTRLVNNLAKKNKLVKEADPSLSGDHVREGLAGVISVKVPSPEFEGQTKTRLGNPEVRRLVDQAVMDQLGLWLESHPAALSAIVGKALTAARAAEAARKARELVRRKHVLTRSTLPGKLADCTSSDKEATEIFLVEGDSAGGSAKQARDRHTQAILPLRGKILNVERKDDSALYKNQEIASLIVALGLGTKGSSNGSSSSRSKGGRKGGRQSSSSVGVSADDEGGAAAATGSADGDGSSSSSDPLKGLRYGKVVLLTDADVDGAHIRTLLLTFLFRYKRELFEAGRVYVAVPPLYRIEVGRGQEPLWAYDDAGLQKILQDLSRSRAAGRQPAVAAAAAAAGDAAGTKGRHGSSRRGTTAAGDAPAAAAAAAMGDADGDSSVATLVPAAAAAAGGGGAGFSLPTGVSVTRFKGLGEMMPEQLWSTTLNPETRVLRRLTLEDAAAASHTFVLLMGDKVAPRRALIESEGQRYTLEQLDV